MRLVIAGHFLAGAILTWALPIGLLTIIGLYWTLVLRRSDFDEPDEARGPDAR
jgi:cytochrome c-type biogenesis protein CcmH/NrfF